MGQGNLKLPKISLDGVPLSLYSSLGLCVFLASNVLWYEGNVELDLPFPPGYEFTLERSEHAIIMSIFVFFLILAATLFFEKRINRLTDEQKTRTRLPFGGAVLNTLFTFVLYVLLVYMAIGEFVVSGFTLMFDFTVAGIVGLSTYLHFTLPSWKNRKIGKRRGTSEIEALKLEYDWCWKVINAIYWSAIIIVASAWFFWWNQYANVVIPVSEWGSLAVAKLTTAIALQMIYIGLGLWFGIIGKLVGFSRHIPRQIRASKIRE